VSHRLSPWITENTAAGFAASRAHQNPFRVVEEIFIFLLTSEKKKKEKHAEKSIFEGEK
jgi:hypothetical protein